VHLHGDIHAPAALRGEQLGDARAQLGRDVRAGGGGGGRLGPSVSSAYSASTHAASRTRAWPSNMDF